jgi:N-acetylmuramic acid 6-phosphate etherase
MEDNLLQLQTEVRNLNSINIAEMTTLEDVVMMNKEDEKCAPAVGVHVGDIAKMIDICIETIKNGHHVVFLGCAHSGYLGTLDVFEANAQFGCTTEFISIIAGNFTDMLKTEGGAEDSETNAELDLNNNNITKDDYVIAISASGRTPYIIGALKYCKNAGIKTAVLTNNDYSIVGKYADLPIVVTPGPEVITGSTRLKSGTCTKMILNMITTITMAKIGRTYSNLMINVSPSSHKMELRLEYIMQQATDCSLERANELLNETNYNISTALVMEIKKCNKVSAEKRLVEFKNNVNEACK